MRINISPQLCVLAAAFVLLIPLPWLLGWIFATSVHEISHCIMLRLCGKRIESVCFDVGGARIQTQDLSCIQTVLCSIAGPTGGLLLLSVSDFFPRAAICALIQSVYNLLPIYPLDGGRALRGFLNMILPEKVSTSLCSVVERLFLLVISVISLIAAFAWKLGVMPLFVAVLFALRVCKTKIPCKSTLNRVQ